MRVVKFLFFGALIFLSACRADIRHEQFSHDGRHGSTCAHQIGRRGVCFVPYEKILANPESLDGAVIGVIGYLAIDSGDLLLFPSKERHANGDYPSAIGFRLSYEEENALAEKHAWTYVNVSAVFSSNYFNPDFPRLGMMTGEVDILYVEEKIKTKADEEVFIKIWQFDGLDK